MKAPPARLVVLNTDLQGKVYTIAREGATIGRGPENDICLDQASVSRRHARIEPLNDRYRIRDLGSRNGIKVNDHQVTEAILDTGPDRSARVTLAIGDVLLNFVEAGQGATSPVAPSAGRQAPRTPAAHGPQTVAPPAQGKQIRRSVLLASVVLTALVVLLGGGALYILAAGGPEIRTLSLLPVKVAVNEQRLVPLKLVVGRAGEGGRTYWFEVLAKSVRSDDPGVATASKYEDRYILVSGRSGGATTIRMNTPRGNEINIRVLVRGRVPDKLQEYRMLPIGEKERRERAGNRIKTGDRLARRHPYEALEQYKIARALLEPLAEKGGLYVDAADKVNELESHIQAKYQELSSAVRQAAAANDIDLALRHLNAIMELIPDETDPRHQHAEMAAGNVIMQIETSKR